ncbi:UrcA family protein [Altererythrobacter lutimaris]|uniref:UrcA family protein n=1 Tax=Altererythrobacter lutimaris TaxID=2743979 RepID=A0A850H885_9SPHN|nr:UrcA family protein [Altererythrobacter lutimaris]NVE95377.1 UrcA family protein [Altererythrobacter lutimaris]
MTKTFAAAAACSLALIANPALAGNADTQKMSVEYGDLDLSSPQGQARLNTRIDKAARKVCGMNEIQTGTRIRSDDAQRCYDKAVNSATKSMATIIAKQWRGG